MELIICKNNEELIRPKDDLMFKALFGREDGKEILHDLLNSILKLDIPTPNDITIMNTEVETNPGKKGSRLDVRVKTSDNVHIDIEVQINENEDMMKRSAYYASKLFVAQLGKGGDYNELGRAVTLNFIDFNIFKDDARWLYRGRLFDTEKKTQMTDCIELNFVELKKLPEITEEYNAALLWAKFINAKSEKELDMLSEQNTHIASAVDKLHTLSADDALRYEYDMREKMRMDINAEKRFIEKVARMEEKCAVAMNLIMCGVDIGIIAKSTGLSEEEILALNAKRS